MNESFLLAVQQLALQDLPLTISEVRQMAIRHLLSTIHDDNRWDHGITAGLFQMYGTLYDKEFQDDPAFVSHRYDAALVLKEAFLEGFNFARPDLNGEIYFYYPGSLQLDGVNFYPVEILKQFGNAWGYQAANLIADGALRNEVVEYA